MRFSYVQSKEFYQKALSNTKKKPMRLFKVTEVLGMVGALKLLKVT